MDVLAVVAGVLMVLLGSAHSILGERLIFARLRQDRDWSDPALGVLERRRWWALRGTWHLVTILAIGLGVMLLAEALGQADIKRILGATVLVAAVYWAIATRLGHPAWIVLGVIGVLLLVPN